METNDLIKIWNALADNKLLDKELVEVNIADLIKKKNAGILAKMKKRVIFDFVLYLSALILIPIVVFIVSIVLERNFQIVQFFGILIAEGYLLYMFLKSWTKLKGLNNSDYTLSLKEGMLSFRDKYKRMLSKEYISSIIFGYALLLVALVQYFIFKGTLFPIFIEGDHNYIFMFIVIMLIALPFIIKMEYNLRYSKLMKSMDESIEDLD